MERQRFSMGKRLLSFKHAFNGFKVLIREEHNSRVHFFFVVLAVFAGVILDVSSNEWIAVILASGLVISMEIINSAIENIADFISPEKHESIKKIKDLSAAAVLTSAIAAMVIGLLIFIPKLLGT